MLLAVNLPRCQVQLANLQAEEAPGLLLFGGLQDRETVALELDDSQREASALREAVAASDEQHQALAAHVQRRLARLRWQHAAAAVLTPGRSGLLQRQVGCSLGWWGL